MNNCGFTAFIDHPALGEHHPLPDYTEYRHTVMDNLRTAKA